MPGTYNLISSTTLTSDVNNFSISSIPQNFTDLILIGNWRASGSASLELRFNSDTSTLYSITWLIGNGTSASSSRALNESILNTNIYGPSNSDVFASAQVFSYSNTNVNKTVLFSGGSSQQLSNRSIGMWRSTNAISSINISTYFTVNFLSGSKFSLYGIGI